MICVISEISVKLMCAHADGADFADFVCAASIGYKTICVISEIRAK